MQIIKTIEKKLVISIINPNEPLKHNISKIRRMSLTFLIKDGKLTNPEMPRIDLIREQSEVIGENQFKVFYTKMAGQLKLLLL